MHTWADRDACADAIMAIKESKKALRRAAQLPADGMVPVFSNYFASFAVSNAAVCHVVI